MKMLVYETIQIPNSGGSRLLASIPNSRLCHIKHIANKAALAKHSFTSRRHLNGLMYLQASFMMLNN